MSVELNERRQQLLAGGGKDRVAKQHEAGKMTARERLGKLFDEGSFVETGVFAAGIPAVSTFYISQKLGGTNNTMIGDVIELQFKGSLNRNFGAAMSLVLMLLVFVSIWLMNRFTDDEEGVATI